MSNTRKSSQAGRGQTSRPTLHSDSPERFCDEFGNPITFPELDATKKVFEQQRPPTTSRPDSRSSSGDRSSNRAASPAPGSMVSVSYVDSTSKDGGKYRLPTTPLRDRAFPIPELRSSTGRVVTRPKSKPDTGKKGDGLIKSVGNWMAASTPKPNKPRKR